MSLTEDQFNSNWFVQDGFLVSKKARKIVNVNSPTFQDKHKKVCRFIESNYSEPFQDFDDLRLDSRNAFPLASSEMFQYVDTIVVWIQQTENQGEKYFNKMPEDSTGDAFEATAHIIRLPTKYKCCVYVPTSLTADDDVYLYTMDESLQIPRKEKDTSYFNKSMRLHEYKWQQEDIDTLTELLEDSAPIWKDLVLILIHMKQNFSIDQHAQAHAASFMSVNREMLVKDLLDNTLRAYARYLLPFYVMLLNLGEFKCFERTLAEFKQAYPDFSLGCLLDDFGEGEKVAAKAEKLNEMFSKFYSNTESVAKLVREMIVVSFFEKKEGKMVVVTTYKALKILDGLKTLFKYSMAYTFVGYDVLLKTMVYTPHGKRPPIIHHVEVCYHNILKDNIQDAKYQCEEHIEDKSCTVNNALIRVSDLTSTYATMIQFYHRVLEDLAGYDQEKGNSVNMTWDKLIASKRGKPDKESEGSFLTQFDEAAMKSLQIRVSRSDIVQKKSLFVGMLNKLSKTLQVLVWITLGMNLRYPELSSLSFAGNQRNIFYHDYRKRIVVMMKYSKNQKYETRRLFLNEEVSKLVLHYAAVLKNFYFTLFKDENGNLVMPPLAEHPSENTAEDPAEDAAFGYSQGDIEGEEDARTEADQSEGFYYSMLFINSPYTVDKPVSLTTRKSFTSWMQRYMPGETNVSLRVLRQAAVVFSRMATMQTNSNTQHLAQHLAFDNETSFGHSVLTGEANYGVTVAESFADSNGVNFLRSRSWHEFLDIEKSSLLFCDSLNRDRFQEHFDKEDIDSDEETSQCVSTIPRFHRDLEEAGREVYGPDFQFQSLDQQDATRELYLGTGLPAVLIHAPTGFGKTAMFALPIVCLTKKFPGKYLNVVAVPYSSLKVSIITRLRDMQLEVGDATELGSESYVDSCCRNSTFKDVYVGVFDNFADSNPYYALQSVHRGHHGYFIIDEVHTIAEEVEFRKKIKKLYLLKFKRWMCLLMFSASVNFHLDSADMTSYKDILDVLHLKEESVYVNNLVKKLNHSNRVFLHHVLSEQEEVRRAKLFNLLFSYEQSQGTKKVMVFFDSKSRLESVFNEYTARNRTSKALKLDGDHASFDKSNITNKFCYDSACKVIMGTKLLSNGIDCVDVDLVVLFEANFNTIDYIQAIGRIRKKGVALSIRADFQRCPTKQIRRFYNLDSSGSSHDTCCSQSSFDDAEVGLLVEKTIDILNAEPLEPTESEADDDTSILGEPASIMGEPASILGEPASILGEPAPKRRKVTTELDWCISWMEKYEKPVHAFDEKAVDIYKYLGSNFRPWFRGCTQFKDSVLTEHRCNKCFCYSCPDRGKPECGLESLLETMIVVKVFVNQVTVGEAFNYGMDKMTDAAIEMKRFFENVEEYKRLVAQEKQRCSVLSRKPLLTAQVFDKVQIHNLLFRLISLQYDPYLIMNCGKLVKIAGNVSIKNYIRDVLFNPRNKRVYDHYLNDDCKLFRDRLMLQNANPGFTMFDVRMEGSLTGRCFDCKLSTCNRGRQCPVPKGFWCVLTAGFISSPSMRTILDGIVPDWDDTTSVDSLLKLVYRDYTLNTSGGKISGYEIILEVAFRNLQKDVVDRDVLEVKRSGDF